MTEIPDKIKDLSFFYFILTVKLGKQCERVLYLKQCARYQIRELTEAKGVILREFRHAQQDLRKAFPESPARTDAPRD